MSALIQSEMLWLGDLPAPVALRVPAKMRDLLAQLLNGWTFEPWHGRACNPVLAMEMTSAGRFAITGHWAPVIEDRSDIVDAACGFIAELIRAYVNEVPGRLCLHAAGAVCDGRLLVFLGTRRAGKSVLSVAMAAAGLRLAGDDIIMIDTATGSAVAGGFSPRLRLPLPHNLAPAIRAFIDTHSGPSGQQYAYLTLGPDLIAGKDERFDIGAFILLDRKDSGPAVLRPIEKSTSLSAVVWQNFARRAPSADILDRLYGLVERCGTAVLEYSAVEDAVQLLQDRFSTWPADIQADAGTSHTEPSRASEVETPLPAASASTVTPGSEEQKLSGRFSRRDGVVERELDGKCFLADNEGGTIIVLNQMAAAIWRAMSESATQDELVDLAALAFPETDRTIIEADVGSILRDFLSRHLIVSA